MKLSSTGTSFSYTLNNSTFKRKKKSSSTDSKKTDSPDDNLDEMDDGTGGQNNQKKDDNLELDSDGYAHWSFPWSLTLNYSVNYSYGEFDKQKMDYRENSLRTLASAAAYSPPRAGTSHSLQATTSTRTNSHT